MKKIHVVLFLFILTAKTFRRKRMKMRRIPISENAAAAIRLSTFG